MERARTAIRRQREPWPQRMLSVIIATLNSERALVPTLAALVPGAMDGPDQRGASWPTAARSDDTAAVADVAGCNFLLVEGPLGPAAEDRGRGGARALAVVPAAGNRARCAVDRRGAGASSSSRPRDRQRGGVPPRRRRATGAARSAVAACRRAAARCRGPSRACSSRKQFYDALGGHSETRRRSRSRPHPPHRPAAHRLAATLRSAWRRSCRYLT